MKFGKPSFTRKEEQAILDTLRTGWIGNGPKAREFEKEFSHFVGNRPCVAVNSCTIGLMIALKTIQKDKPLVVATSPLTFAATANAVINTGNQIVFVDTKEDGTIDPKQIPPVDVIITVHYTGTPCDMDEITPKGIVIEDSAHGFGGTYKGKPLGSIGDFGVFSFYPTKNITTIDGGMIVTKDKETSLKARIWANQGQTYNAFQRTLGDKEDVILYPGFKGAMPDINATIGLTQLRRWNKIKEKRDLIWKIYEREYGFKPEGHSHHLYTIQVENRDELRKELRLKGIQTGIHYKPLHKEPAFKRVDNSKESFPNAERIGETTLSLPISAEMTEWDAIQVIKAVKKHAKFAEAQLVAA